MRPAADLETANIRKNTVLIVDGGLVPTRDHTVAEQSKNHRYPTSGTSLGPALSRAAETAGGWCGGPSR